MVLNLDTIMNQYEKEAYKLCDSKYIKDRKKGIEYMHKWNKIRKIIEYQEECIK